jgi:hypothetical protein
MALRVISTKLSEEEYSKITQICNNAGCTLSAFLKDCVMDLVDKESHKIEKPQEETINAPEFTLSNEPIVHEHKLTPKIRYQYF